MKRSVSAAVLLVILLSPMAEGQRGRFRNQIPENHEVPNSEFVLARWHYTAGWRGDGWGHDYPVAEEHILQIMSETTGLNTSRLSYRVVELSSPEIFKYPFAYISEPGEMLLSEKEIENLREYIERGGFIMVDDFWRAGRRRRIRQVQRKVDSCIPRSPDVSAHRCAPVIAQLLRCRRPLYGTSDDPREVDILWLRRSERPPRHGDLF